MVERRYTDRVIYQRLMQQARPYWGHIALIFLVSLFSAPLALLPPLPLKLAVDSVIGDEPLPAFVSVCLPDSVRDSPMALLAVIAVLVIAIETTMYLHSLVWWLLKTYTGEKLILEFRSRLFRHAQALSLKYHDSQGTADSTYRIQYDSDCVRAIALEGIGPFLTSTLSLLAMLFVTALIDWQISVIAVAIMPLLLLLMQQSSKRLRGTWGQVKRLESRSMSLVQEVLGAVRVVKAFGREDDEQLRFEHQARQIVRGHLRVAGIESGFDLLVGLTIGAGTAAALYIGISHVRAGVITLGELLLVMAYLMQLYQPLETFIEKVAGLQSALASAERAFHILDEDPDVPEAPDGVSLDRAAGKCVFQNVSFAYEEDRPALQGIDLEIAPGSRVGIIGQTGAGKSTLVSLLMRFYDPTSGVIQLDDVDLREFRLADLRRQFAVVMQDTVLFSTSIIENIAYAAPGASREEIEAAARAAHADAFISKLPEGYLTPVGERGLQLSGGERQRISLARAFLRDAPILILDEPTSSVDMETEEEIIDAMERLMQRRTTLIIAHRLITLRKCDVVLELENGRLRETLKPAEIMRQMVDRYGPHAVDDSSEPRR